MATKTAAKPTAQDKTAIGPEAALTAILALMIDEREARIQEKDEVPAKTEVVLFSAGLTADEIARLTGKKTDTVRKTISRAGGKDA